jgi:GTP-binding protein EngB required for normal cell division
MKNEINIKEKVKRIASTIEQNDNGNGYNYFEEMMKYYYSADSDFTIIKQKMDNLIKLLESKTEEEVDEFMDLDFEEEIWEMI